MENNEKIFFAALKTFLLKRGSKTRLAKEAEMAPSRLTDMINGRQSCGYKTQIQLIKALGYSERDYQKFLDIGRRELGLPLEENIKSASGPESENGSEKKDGGSDMVLISKSEWSLMHRYIDDLRADKAIWQKEKEQIYQQLESFNKAVNDLHRFIRESGLEVPEGITMSGAHSLNAPIEELKKR